MRFATVEVDLTICNIFLDQREISSGEANVRDVPSSALLLHSSQPVFMATVDVVLVIIAFATNYRGILGLGAFGVEIRFKHVIVSRFFHIEFHEELSDNF